MTNFEFEKINLTTEQVLERIRAMSKRQIEEYEVALIQGIVTEKISELEGFSKERVMELTSQINEIGDTYNEWFAFALREKLLSQDFNFEAEMVKDYSNKNNIKINK